MFNNIKKTLHYSVHTRTSCDKVRIPDEAERVQSVSHSHITSLSGLYTVVCLREGKQGTCLNPHVWGPRGRKNFALKIIPTASEHTISATLSQADRPVVFCSRTL